LNQATTQKNSLHTLSEPAPSSVKRKCPSTSNRHNSSGCFVLKNFFSKGVETAPISVQNHTRNIPGHLSPKNRLKTKTETKHGGAKACSWLAPLAQRAEWAVFSCGRCGLVADRHFAGATTWPSAGGLRMWRATIFTRRHGGPVFKLPAKESPRIRGPPGNLRHSEPQLHRRPRSLASSGRA